MLEKEDSGEARLVLEPSGAGAEKSDANDRRPTRSPIAGWDHSDS